MDMSINYAVSNSKRLLRQTYYYEKTVVKPSKPSEAKEYVARINWSYDVIMSQSDVIYSTTQHYNNYTSKLTAGNQQR